MRRRTVLTAVGTLGVGFAGCVSDGGDEGDGAAGETATETDTSSATVTETPMTPTLTDTTIERLANDCGQQVNVAEITIDDQQVVVEGTIWAPDPGHGPTVAATYDADEDTLSVTTGTEDQGDGPVAQCIAEIEYRAMATFADGLPGAVTVVHETNEGSETVATAERE